jgi:hypothetical protein
VFHVLKFLFGFSDAQASLYCDATGRYYSLVTSQSGFSQPTAVNLAGSTWFKDFNPGYLASITSPGERDCVVKFFTGAYNFIWIGGVDYYSEGTFRWVDGPEAGTPVPNLWDVNEPGGGVTENCLMISSAGKFHDVLCSSLLTAFLIEYTPDDIQACKNFFTLIMQSLLGNL